MLKRMKKHYHKFESNEKIINEILNEILGISKNQEVLSKIETDDNGYEKISLYCDKLSADVYLSVKAIINPFILN